MESDSPEVDLDEGAPGVDPYHGLGGSASEQAAALRQPASLQWDKAEGFEDVARSLASSSADNLLAQLDAVCTDWESESNPLTLHVIYKVHTWLIPPQRHLPICVAALTAVPIAGSKGKASAIQAMASGYDCGAKRGLPRIPWHSPLHPERPPD